ncbi:NAD(P)H-dependent flavin oxidoreductase YrpB, nitropropane dioxygenase family [Sulfobacillus thermosulfidooxidans DSM 9293]|uniref:Probable nitronate monooxygenase n=1 Tax=Sulfobacillus thermosulfidooxidans (strain DSM 9293 / VKM B-1269 / AT-1) TaxID=929705 RepID=A0A1W1WDT1_SULTA|nr:nitronate monooxygenase [Sulfobacillus thermosulfidooxidans]SMC04471.1 NAD(P)H-dependent flavin oxidoreductase YrpB, nitropropane dioxygenase family [Sulfobacillus thermosulfidooxidans DSM 9293]
MIQTRVTELLHIRRPIIQGGLAYLARAPLTAAVSEAGGLGQITATTLDDVGQLRQEIHEVRQRTNQPFGVNFALGHRPIDDLLDVAIEEQVPVISLTGGNPKPFARRIIDAGIRLMVLTAGVRAAKNAESLGADIVVAVGVEGGGHLGRDDVGTMVLTRKIVESVQVPVVASGGIGDGYGLLAALALGAQGIEMGTRFVATKECPAHPSYKDRLINTQENETRIIERSIGRPGRVLPSPYVETILAHEPASSIDELLPYISGDKNRSAALDGQWDEGFAWGGQVTGLITDIPSVAELLERMEDEALSMWTTLGKMFGH